MGNVGPRTGKHPYDSNRKQRLTTSISSMSRMNDSKFQACC
jgi:hypothetical protein